MRIINDKERSLNLVSQLVEVWYRSVKETHLFLSDQEIENIKAYVPDAISNVAHLIVVENSMNEAIGFMGIENQRLEMLFIDPEYRKLGLGKQLIEYGITHYEVNDVAVNEQNPNAIGFYEHMGFVSYKRTEQDEQGNDYPLWYMKLKS